MKRSRACFDLPALANTDMKKVEPSTPVFRVDGPVPHPEITALGARLGAVRFQQQAAAAAPCCKRRKQWKRDDSECRVADLIVRDGLCRHSRASAPRTPCHHLHAPHCLYRASHRSRTPLRQTHAVVSRTMLTVLASPHRHRPCHREGRRKTGIVPRIKSEMTPIPHCRN